MRRREFLGVLGGAAAGLLENPAAAAEGRMALVIGNSAYQHLPVLKTPIHDANAIAALLSRASFAVTSGLNQTIPDMRERLRKFSATFVASGRDTVALVFYAGHGAQVDNEYYLLPVDARIRERSDLSARTLSLTEVMSALPTAPNRILIVILDASRSNPFAAPKDQVRGIVDAPIGTIVAYATSPGEELIESNSLNSFYTTALLEVMKEPGLAVELVFKKVRIRVHEQSARQQIPAETSSLRRNFSFFPARPAR
jgi:uncharacterized caspase-like protein